MSGPPFELVFQEYPGFVYATASSCRGCSRVDDPTIGSLAADAPSLTFDVAETPDRAVIASDRFRRACLAIDGVEFHPLGGVDDVWLLDVERTVRLEPFDSHVRAGPECDVCGCPRYATRTGPLVLEPDEVLPSGFSRSDVVFGDTADFGPDQPIRMRPSILLDRDTARRIKRADLLGVHLITQPE